MRSAVLAVPVKIVLKAWKKFCVLRDAHGSHWGIMTRVGHTYSCVEPPAVQSLWPYISVVTEL